ELPAHELLPGEQMLEHRLELAARGRRDEGLDIASIDLGAEPCRTDEREGSDAVRGIDRRLHGNSAAERVADEVGGLHLHLVHKRKERLRQPAQRRIGYVFRGLAVTGEVEGIDRRLL